MTWTPKRRRGLSKKPGLLRSVVANDHASGRWSGDGPSITVQIALLACSASPDTTLVGRGLGIVWLGRCVRRNGVTLGLRVIRGWRRRGRGLGTDTARHRLHCRNGHGLRRHRLGLGRRVARALSAQNPAPELADIAIGIH